jgi:hypothetical protein
MTFVSNLLELSESCNAVRLNLPQRFWAKGFDLWHQVCGNLHPLMRFWQHDYFGRTILNFRSFDDVKALEKEPAKLLGILHYMKKYNYTAKPQVANMMKVF